MVRGALIRSYPAQWSAGRGLGKPVSDNCADRGRDDAISNLIDSPILQDRFGFGPWINRPDAGHNAHQHICSQKSCVRRLGHPAGAASDVWMMGTRGAHWFLT